jgi:hypothetical protein
VIVVEYGACADSVIYRNDKNNAYDWEINRAHLYIRKYKLDAYGARYNAGKVIRVFPPGLWEDLKVIEDVLNESSN